MEKKGAAAPPRSGREILVGIPWLARAIDKGRMLLEDRIGDYVFPCAIDEEILRILGLTDGEFLEILKGSRDDAEVLRALSWRVSSLGAGEWIRLDAFLVRYSRLLDEQDREEGRSKRVTEIS